jgi:hypothetical protein
MTTRTGPPFVSEEVRALVSGFPAGGEYGVSRVGPRIAAPQLAT